MLIFSILQVLGWIFGQGGSLFKHKPLITVVFKGLLIIGGIFRYLLVININKKLILVGINFGSKQKCIVEWKEEQY